MTQKQYVLLTFDKQAMERHQKNVRNTYPKPEPAPRRLSLKDAVEPFEEMSDAELIRCRIRRRELKEQVKDLIQVVEV